MISYKKCIGLYFFIMVLNNLASGLDGSVTNDLHEIDSMRSEQGVLVEGIADDSISFVDINPQIVKFVKAEYPKQLLSKGKEGSVILDLLIDTSGNVDSVTVVEGCDSLFALAALNAARQFLFTPAFFEKTPVAVILRYAYHFSIDDQEIKLNEFVNLWGTIYEKGTKIPLSNTVVALIFSEADGKKNKYRKNKILFDSLPGGIPRVSYLKKIGSLSGQVYEQGQLITRTDSLGYFSFKSIPTSMIKIKINEMGYKSFHEEFVCSSEKLTKIKIYLEKDSYNQNEITVYGKSESPEVQQYDIPAQEIFRVPGFNGEALKVVQALPGVARPALGGEELIIRGSDNQTSKVLFDGIQLPYLYHKSTSDFFMYRSIISSHILKAVSYYPGGMGVRYGDVLGGVVELTSRGARTDRFHGVFDANLKDYTLLLEGPVTKKVSAIGLLRGSLFTFTNEFVTEKIMGGSVTNKQNELDYLVRIDYSPNHANQLFIESIGAIDTVTIKKPNWMTNRKLTADEIPLSFGQKFFQGIGGWNWQINESLKNELRLAVRTEYSRMSDKRWDFYQLQQNDQVMTFDFRDEFCSKISNRLTVTPGIDIHISPFVHFEEWFLNDTSYVTGSGSILLGHISAYLNSKWQPILLLPKYAPGNKIEIPGRFSGIVSLLI